MPTEAGMVSNGREHHGQEQHQEHWQRNPFVGVHQRREQNTEDAQSNRLELRHSSSTQRFYEEVDTDDAGGNPTEERWNVRLPNEQVVRRWRDRDATGSTQQRTLKQQHASKSDDERRDPESRNEVPLDYAEDCANDNRGDECRPQWPFRFHEDNGRDCAEQTSQSSDREIDLPRHDHKDHRYREDRGD